MSTEKLFLDAAKIALPEFALPELAEKLSILTETLADVGSHMNLTAITEPEKVVWLHLIDSLHGAALLSELTLPEGRIADVGSGGGFPALPLAAALPDLHVTAIDSTEKKCRYIAECAERMGISNVDTKSIRAEEYGRSDGRESFAAVTARAVARLSVLTELCLPLVKVGGYFLAMKGATAEVEAEEAARGAKILGAVEERRVEYTLGDFADRRMLILYKKIAPTPEKYPRQYGKISKSPLV